MDDCIFREVDLAVVETLTVDGLKVRRSVFGPDVVTWEHLADDGTPTLASKAVAAELEARYRSWRGVA